MEERSSDTAQTYGSQPLPVDVSNQNAEETGAPQDVQSDAHKHRPKPDDGNPGGAGEHSQATGHPQNAG
jgi:hypothetical protein